MDLYKNSSRPRTVKAVIWTAGLALLILLGPLPAPQAAPDGAAEKGAVGKDRPEYRAPSALAADGEGRYLYVAESASRQIAVIDLKTLEKTRSIALSEPPGAMTLSADGTRLFVTAFVPDGTVRAFDLQDVDGGEKGPAVTWRVGHSPSAVVAAPDGSTLYVCNRFDNTVSVIDIGSGEQTALIDVEREPVAAALGADGAFLFVANHLPGGAADGDYSAAGVSVIDTALKRATAFIPLPNGSTGLRALCAAPDGKHVYVTHILARYQLPTTQLERGWMNTNAVSVIDAREGRLINTVLVDDVDLGAANPWGVACTSDGGFLCVAHAGTHEVSVIDRAALHAKLERSAAGERVSDAAPTAASVPNDLSYLVGLRRRVALSGCGPRGLAVAGRKVFAAEHFSDSVAAIDLSAAPPWRALSISLGATGPIPIERRGESLFNDARLCFQMWQSCASCHPDGRADGLNWDLLNDGLGNAKNTKSLLLAHKTPPSMITGVRDRAETAVRAGIRHIQFALRPEDDARAIDAYLMAMTPVASPWLHEGKLSRSAERGAVLFQDAGCASCHAAPLLTNLQAYDVGLGTGRDEGRAFDTPTLVEVWRTGPFLFDGRAQSVRDVLTTHNRREAHGATKELTNQEIEDLAAFVLSQ